MRVPSLFDSDRGARSWHETFRGEAVQAACILICLALFGPRGLARWTYGVAAVVVIAALAIARRRDRPEDYATVDAILTAVLLVQTGISLLTLK